MDPASPNMDRDVITDHLVVAAADGNTQVLLQAIAQGDPARIGLHGVSHVMASACWENQLAAAQAWLPVFVPGHHKKPQSHHEDPLETASDKGFDEMVELLLPKYAPGEDLDMALYCAASKGHERIVRRLLDKGANPKAVRSSALVAAARRDQCHIVAILAPLSDVELALSQCGFGARPGVRALIAYHEATLMQGETAPVARTMPSRRV